MAEFTDFHVVIIPKSWDPDDQKGKLKGEVVSVTEGHEALVVGKTRTFSVFRNDRNGNSVPAFAAVRDSASDLCYPIEVQGYSQPGGQGQYGPITYHTIQRARKFTGDLPQNVAQGGSQAPGSSGGRRGGSGGGDGSAPYTAEDRRRSVASWAIKQAAITVAHGKRDAEGNPLGLAFDPPEPNALGDRDEVWNWAAWYAAAAYRLGAMIEANEDDWTKGAPTRPDPNRLPAETQDPTAEDSSWSSGPSAAEQEAAKPQDPSGGDSGGGTDDAGWGDPVPDTGDWGEPAPASSDWS